LRLDIIINTLRFEVYRISRSPGLLMQLCAGFIFIGCALLIEAISEALIAEFDDAASHTLPAALAIARAKAEQYGLESNPLLLAYGYLIHILTPGIALTLGANQTTRDLSSGHARILLSRMSRREFLVSRFVSTWIQWALVAGVSCGWGAFMLSDILAVEATNGWASAFRYGFGSIIYALPFLAYGACLNTVFRTPLNVLIGGSALWFGWSLLLSAVTKSIPEHLWERVPEALTIGAGSHLLDVGGSVMVGMGLCLLYSALFLSIGSLLLGRRELR